MPQPNIPNTLRKMWQLSNVLESKLGSDLQAVGFYHPRAYFLLEKVGECPNPSKLATSLSLPAPSISFIVKYLEERGYLQRTVERQDLRRYKLEVTPAGEEALAKGADVLRSYSKRLFSKFSISEIEDFEKFVAILSL